MVQLKTERLLKRYCPKCGTQMQVWGAKKHGMALCLDKSCNMCIRVEDTLKLEDLEEVKKLVKVAYLEGVEMKRLMGGITYE